MSPIAITRKGLNMREINRSNKSKSIYGDARKQIYRYMEFLKENIKRKIDVLIVDGNDGKEVVPFAKNGFVVTCYEDDEILLNGGVIDNLKTTGLKKRLLDNELLDNVLIKELNYYEVKEINKFDFVYAESSLSLYKNKDISTKKKVRKLMSSVREGGYLYIHYDLAQNDNENEYPSNLYLKVGEMSTFFELEDWQIIYIRERTDIINMNNKDRKVGYVLACKKRNRRKYKYHYTIEINNKF